MRGCVRAARRIAGVELSSATSRCGPDALEDRGEVLAGPRAHVRDHAGRVDGGVLGEGAVIGA